VSEPDWAERHLRVLKLHYSQAPFFGDLESWLDGLYLIDHSEFLSEINEKFIRAISNRLGIETKIRRSSEMAAPSGKNERLISLCRQAGVTDYYTGPSARTYLDEGMFLSHGIKVKWIDYSAYLPYPQLFGPFEHGVTILDLLLNTGPAARQYMKSFPQSKQRD
jgi:hypothetical protein